MWRAGNAHGWTPASPPSVVAPLGLRPTRAARKRHWVLLPGPGNGGQDQRPTIRSRRPLVGSERFPHLAGLLPLSAIAANDVAAPEANIMVRVSSRAERRQRPPSGRVLISDCSSSAVGPARSLGERLPMVWRNCRTRDSLPSFPPERRSDGRNGKDHCGGARFWYRSSGHTIGSLHVA